MLENAMTTVTITETPLTIEGLLAVASGAPVKLAEPLP
jgi:hypothetical protein